MHLAGLSDIPFHVPETGHNLSFSHEVYELISAYNSQFETPYFPADLIRFLETVLNGKWKKPPYEAFSVIIPQRCVEILNEFSESNRVSAKKYLNRDGGQLFYDPWPDPAQPFEPHEGLSLELLTRFFLDVFIKLFDMIQKQDLKFRELESRLSNLEKKAANDTSRKTS